jgi:ankyrin repeat protein
MTLIDYVKLGNITKIQELIDQGVDLNVQDEYGYTPLIWASCYNKPDMVKLLLKAGANKDITDVDKHNALYWANYYNNLEVIDLLNKNLDGKQTLTKKKKGK